MRNNDLGRARTGLSAAGRTRIPKKNRLCFTRKLINKNRFPVSDILILRFPQLMKIFFFLSMKFMKFIVVMKTDTKTEFNKVEVDLAFSCCFDCYWRKREPRFYCL